MPKKPGYVAAHWVPAATAREYPIDAFITPKSGCCDAEIVYYSKQENLFIALPSNYEDMPRYVVWRCRKCDREIDRDSRKEAK